MITRFDGGNSRADVDDFSGGFMAQDSRQRHGNHLLLTQLIGMAQTAPGHLDEHFIGFWRCDVDGFNNILSAGLTS